MAEFKRSEHQELLFREIAKNTDIFAGSVEEEEIKKFVDRLDQADGKDDYQIPINCETSEEDPNSCFTRTSFNRGNIYEAANLTISSSQLRRQVIRSTERAFSTPSLWRYAKEHPQYVDNKSVYTNPQSMREKVAELKKELGPTGVRSLKELGVDENTAIGKQIATDIQFLDQNGLAAMAERFSKIPPAAREAYMKALLTDYPIRMKLTYDGYYPLRVQLSLEMVNYDQFLNEPDPIQKWRLKVPDQVPDLNEPRPADMPPEEDRPFFPTLAKSALWVKFKAYPDPVQQNLNFDASQIAHAYTSHPEALALLIEGLAFMREKEQPAQFLMPNYGELPSETITYQGSDWKDLEFTFAHRVPGSTSKYALTNQGRQILSKVLSMTQQLLPDGNALKTGRPSDFAGSHLRKNVEHGFLNLYDSYFSSLTQGNKKGATLAKEVGTLTHEMGHYFYQQRIDRECDNLTLVYSLESDQLKDDPRAPILKERLQQLYQQALLADAGLIFSDSTYEHSCMEMGHPWDNADEFFASSFKNFILHADELATNINRPETPPEVKAYAIEMWKFLRDEVFYTVFTENGRDPFP